MPRLQAQTTTETFETFSADATSFTSNGQVFNITTNIPTMPWAVFDIYYDPSPQGPNPSHLGLGWNGTAKDDRFIDNSGGTFTQPNVKAGVNVNFSIATQGATPFQVKSLWIYASKSDAILGASGSVTFTGSLNGVTQFTATSSTGFNTSLAVANGYTLIDFTTYGGSNNASKNIDKLTISTGGQFEYIGLDAFKWSGASVTPAITANPTNAAICEGGTATFSVAATNAASYKWQVSTTGSSGTYSDIANGGGYSNATTSSLTITNPAKTLTNAFYRCVAINGAQQATSTAASLTFSASWTGAVNNNWSVAGNWSCNAVPTDSVDVIINTSPNDPIIGVGSVAIARNLTINTGTSLTLAQNGAMVIDGAISNQGNFNPSATGTRITFRGGNREQLIPAATYYDIVTSGGVKRLAGGVTVNGSFIFGGGKVFLGVNSLVIGATGSVSGAGFTRYFVTNGTGTLKKMSLGNSSFVYPIGTNSAYTPMSLNNSGTSDNFSARVIDGIYRNYIGFTPVGAPITSKVVNKTWFLSEDVAGGSNLQYIVQWNGSDELGNFVRTSSFLANYNNSISSWDNGAVAPPAGSNPYIWTRNGVTSLGPFGLFSTAGATSVNSTTANGTYHIGDVIDIQVAFSENVNVTGTPQLTLETGATDRVANYLSGSGSSTLTFRYTVQTGDASADLAYVSSGALALNGGTIKAGDGSDASLFLPVPGAAGSLDANKNIVIDAVSTVVSTVGVPSNKTYKIGDVLSFTVNFSGNVTVTGTPQLALTVGSTGKTASYASGSGSSALVFSYTVANGDLDGDGIALGTLSLNGGTIMNGATNAVLTLNNIAPTTSVNVDGVLPTLSSVAIASNHTNTDKARTGSVVTLSFVSSEAIASPTVSIAGHTLTATNTGGNNWSAAYTMVSGDTEGVIPFSIGFSDAAGNAGTTVVAATNSVTFDKTSPTAVITSDAGISGSTTAASQVNLTVTFSEPVTGFSLGDLLPSNGTISNFAGSGTTYTLKMAPGTPGNFGVSLGANMAQDAAGNGNVAATAYTLVYDPTPVISTTSNFTALTAVYGSASASSGISVSGTNISGGITATANTGFEVSKDDSNYGSSVTITGSGNPSGTIYVRLKDGNDVGSYNAGSVSLTSSGAATKDISIPSSTVTPASMMIAPINANKIYGQALSGGAGYTSFSIMGLENGEAVSSITIAYGNGAAATDPVGTYTAQVTASAPVGSINPANYTITYLKGDIIVGKATPVITFGSLASKTYGDIDFDPNASSNNGGTPISYASSNPAVATIEAGKIHIVGVGTTTITASQVASTNYNAAADVPQTLTVGKAAQTITFAALPAKTYGDAAFALNATGGASGNAVSYSSSNLSVATITGNTVTIVGAGTTTITASQLGNANYNAAADVPQTLTVGKAAQTITFVALPAKTYGDAAFALNATGGASGNAVSYSSSNLAVATVAGNMVTIVGAGTTTITASQLGNANYNAATDVPQTLTVGKATATITLNNLTQTYDASPKTVAAVTVPAGLSGVTITYDGATTAPAAVGTYAVVASLSNANYTATAATGNLVIGKDNQIITFAPLAAKTYGDAPFALTATGGASGNTVTYTSSNPAVATVAGNMVTIVGAGTINITASQAGDLSYNAAPDVMQALTVNKALATISLSNLAQTFDGSAKAAVATTQPVGLSGVTITYDGSASQPTAAGTYAVVASLAHSNYTATDATGSLVIGKATQTITFNPLANKTFGDAPFTLSAVGGASGNAVTYSSSNTAVVTVSGNTATIVGAGTAIITASQASSANYSAAADVTQTLTVGKAMQTITFAALADKTYGDAPFALVATGGASGNAIAYSSSNTAVATVSGNMVTIVGAGVATITANQAGNGNYDSASAVARTLTVLPNGQVITFNPLADKIYGDAPFALSATGGASGSVVTYTSSNTDIATISGNTLTIVGAGTATITANQLGNANYSAATAVSQALTVTPKSLAGSFTVGDKNYDGNTAAVITARLLAGVVTVDLNAVTLTGGNAFFADANAGTGKTVTATGMTLTGTRAGNYSLASIAPAAASIAPKTITVAAEAKTKTYGDADPALTYAIPAGSLVGTDAISGSLSRNLGNEAGTYAITLGTISAGGNYSINYVGAALTINKKLLAITADNKTRLFNTANPALTVSYSGFVGAENSSVLTTQPSVATTAVIGSPVGNYPITVSGAAANNYDFAYVNGVLTISVNSQTITFAALADKLSTDAPFALTATSSSGLAVAYTSSDAGIARIINGNQVEILKAGTVNITASQAGNGNYTAAVPVVQSLRIIDNPAPVITIASNVGSSISKGETARLTATGAVTYQWSNANGIIAGQGGAVLTVRPSVTTTYTVTGANQYGRTSTQSFVLEVRDDFQAVEATNILTPNGDGVNDKWIVSNIDQYPNSEVKIFDRAGRVLYSKKGYDNSWDATLNGAPLSEGTYFYIIDFGAGKLKKKGFITVVREAK